MEQAPGQTEAQLLPPKPHLADGVIYLARPHSSGGERGRVLESRCGVFILLNGGGFYQNLEVPVDRPLLEVDGLGNAA